MRLRGYLTSILPLLLLSGGMAHSQTAARNSIVIESPWSRATPAGAKNGAIYATVINNGNSDDRLVGAATPVGGQVQFHSVVEENGVSRMRELPNIDVRLGAKVTFSPGGMHIMVVGLKEPLKEGQSFPMTLTFEKAGKIEVMVPVAKVGAMQGPAMDSMTHGVGEPMKK